MKKTMMSCAVVVAVLLASAVGCGYDYYDECTDSCGGVLVCSPTLKLCVNPGDTGAPCATTGDCFLDRDVCVQGACAVGSAEGEVCKDSSECQRNPFRTPWCAKSTNATEGVCILAECTTSKECGLGTTCRDAQCVSPVDIGGACTASSDCEGNGESGTKICAKSGGASEGTCRTSCTPSGYDCSYTEECCSVGLGQGACVPEGLCK